MKLVTFFALLVIIGVIPDCLSVIRFDVRYGNAGHEHHRFVIRPQDLNSGSSLNDQTSRVARRLGKQTDIPGLLIGELLGGDGGDTRNVFPFAPGIYNEKWKAMEEHIYDLVNEGNEVIYQIFISPDVDWPTRPGYFALIAQTVDETINETMTYKTYKAFVKNEDQYNYETYVPDEISLTYTEPYENLEAPIVHCGRGYGARVDYLRAYIDDPGVLNYGRETSDYSEKYARAMGGRYDTAGALLVPELGGVGDRTYNIVPMESGSREAGEKWKQQRMFADSIKNGSHYELRIWPIYSNPTDTRPAVILGYYTENNGSDYLLHIVHNPISFPQGGDREIPRPTLPPVPSGESDDGRESLVREGCFTPPKINGTNFRLQEERFRGRRALSDKVLAPVWSVLVFNCEDGFKFHIEDGQKFYPRSTCRYQSSSPFATWSTMPKCIPISTSGECNLPPTKQSSKYRLASCAVNDTSDHCKLDEGALVRQSTILIHTCAPGYVYPRINGKPLDRSVCMGGSWYPRNFECLKTCEPLSSETMDITCEFEGKPVPCTEPAHQGTKMRPRCKPFYRPQKTVSAYGHSYCLEGGKWGHPLYKCIPVCGRVRRNRQESGVSIRNKNETALFKSPWHAALFKYDDDTGKFKHFCGGTIVSPHFVLTAAHCVYDPVTTQLLIPMDIVVIVGKYSSSYEEEDPTEQRIRVGHIHKMELYRGVENYYLHDVALLELAVAITLREDSLPACIDWTRDGTHINGTEGSIMGFRKDVEEAEIAVLKPGKLPFIDYRNCYERAPTRFRPFLNNDKFCASSIKAAHQGGIIPIQGDSGGGFFFIRGHRHFLYGLLSSRPDEAAQFAVYTNVSIHLSWIYDKLRLKEFGTDAFVTFQSENLGIRVY